MNNFRSAPVRSKTRGTSLVEILVVIVILLVGILAVVQIFPRGFQILTVARKNAVATQLARDEAERLKSRADGLPERIDGDLAWSQLNLPAGWTIDASGQAYSPANAPQGDWLKLTAANSRRTIIGETHRVSAPRKLSETLYGCLITPTFGPIDASYAFLASTSDLERNFNPPADLAPRSGPIYASNFTYSEFEYFVADPNSNHVAVFFPTGPATEFRLSFAALIQVGANVQRRVFTALPINVAAYALDPQSGNQPWYRVQIGPDLVAPALGGGEVFLGLDPDTIRVSRALRSVTTFTANPFEYMTVVGPMGAIVVNPLLASKVVPDAKGRKPLDVVLSYRTDDWRNLRSDFRLSGLDQAQYRLPVAPIKVAGNSGPDGRTLTSLNSLDDPSLDGQTPFATFLLIYDLETGGTVMEHLPGDKNSVRTRINKSLGLITFEDVDANRVGTQVNVRLVDGSVRAFDLEGRSLRALYMARDEWAVQVFKPASEYHLSPVLPAGGGDCYLGGSNPGIGGVPTRLYFPSQDTDAKISITEIHYLDGSGNRRVISGRDFRLRTEPTGVIPRPFLDIREVDESAASFAYDAAPPVRGIKGASISVRTLWNPESFRLGANGAENAAAAERFARSYRRTTVQTYVERGEGSN